MYVCFPSLQSLQRVFSAVWATASVTVVVTVSATVLRIALLHKATVFARLVSLFKEELA